MTDAFAKAISELQEQMKPLEEQIRPVMDQLNAKKKLINQLCVAGGDTPMYPDLDDPKPVLNIGVVRPDQYFGRPLATVVKEILEPRKGSLGAISLDDLFDRLKQGGYQFDNKNDAIAKRNVAITLGKNSAFMKVPNTGAWGLSEWYPGAKRNRPETTSDRGDAGAANGTGAAGAAEDAQQDQPSIPGGEEEDKKETADPV